MNSLELIKWAEERHVNYCCLGDKMLQKFGKCFNRPYFSLFAKNTRIAAWAKYKEIKCGYNLAYLLAVKEEFEETIAHEVAHFVVHQLDCEAKAHGDLFKFVLNEFVGSRARYHYYVKNLSYVTKAKSILKIRELKLQMLKDAAQTESASL